MTSAFGNGAAENAEVFPTFRQTLQFHGVSWGGGGFGSSYVDLAVSSHRTKHKETPYWIVALRNRL
jgi:hypothetical protein